MTPQELVDHLDAEGISRQEFADRLGVNNSSISFWLREGFIAYDRQCHIEKELGRRKGLLRASWDDVPEDKRPVVRVA